MNKIIIEIEPASFECIDKIFRDQIRDLENRLTRWKIKQTPSEYEQSLKKQIIEETLKEISDLRLHHSVIIKANRYELKNS